MNIYVGNLSYSIDEEKLKNLFSPYGTVDTANIITDKYSGQSRGFGFVEMPKDDEAEKAIQALNQTLVDGRNLKVNRARPRQ